MNKNVLIIKGNPRTKGNTATMADISCFGENGSEEGGIIFAYDTRKTDDVKNMHDILNKVYEMGKNI